MEYLLGLIALICGLSLRKSLRSRSRKRRAIEDYLKEMRAVGTVGELAEGASVQIEGLARSKQGAEGTLFGSAVLGWRVTAEIYRRKVLDFVHFPDGGFELEDQQEQRVTIECPAEGVEVLWLPLRRFNCPVSVLDDDMLRAIERAPEADLSWLGATDINWSLWCLRPGEKLRVIGDAIKRPAVAGLQDAYRSPPMVWTIRPCGPGRPLLLVRGEPITILSRLSRRSDRSDWLDSLVRGAGKHQS